MTHEELGGAASHATRSGVTHFVLDSEEECLEEVRRLLSFLPSNNVDDSPLVPTTDPATREEPDLRYLAPDDSNRPYDMRDLIYKVTDDEEFLEVHQSFAPNIVVGFGRMNGRTVGFVGNQPDYMAGVLDIDASNKAARFVRFCDCFNIPLVTFVDVPGFMPGVDQEYGGIIRHGAKLIYAYAEATVPKVSIITRKAYGGAYIVMSSKHLRADVNLVWPSAEIAVMGAEGAVNIIYRELLSKADNPQETRRALMDEYKDRFTNPYVAASRGFVDDVIDPAETRPQLIRALGCCKTRGTRCPRRNTATYPYRPHLMLTGRRANHPLAALAGIIGAAI